MRHKLTLVPLLIPALIWLTGLWSRGWRNNNSGLQCRHRWRPYGLQSYARMLLEQHQLMGVNDLAGKVETPFTDESDAMQSRHGMTRRRPKGMNLGCFLDRGVEAHYRILREI
jgi:hypothetical protein